MVALLVLWRASPGLAEQGLTVLEEGWDEAFGPREDVQVRVTAFM
jgi:hypothetical protein